MRGAVEVEVEVGVAVGIAVGIAVATGAAIDSTVTVPNARHRSFRSVDVASNPKTPTTGPMAKRSAPHGAAFVRARTPTVAIVTASHRVVRMIVWGKPLNRVTRRLVD